MAVLRPDRPLQRLRDRQIALPFMTALLLVGTAAALAADVTKPSEVAGVLVTRPGNDVSLTWAAVTTDVAGNPETVSRYNVYRGTTPNFVPDRSGGSNRIGQPVSAAFVDAGAAANGTSYYYTVTAVDAAGNESATEPSTIKTLPTLSSSYTDTTVELSWTAAGPASQVSGYRVYYGTRPRLYDFFKDVGVSLSTSLTGLQTNTAYYCTVVAIDLNGNESPYSNEVAEAVAGRAAIRAQNDDYLCWGAGGCPPRAGTVQRDDGWQLNVPVDFPPGNWTKVTATFTIDSRLCKVGQHGTTDKCGGTNPGGYNPCGDPWDRIANLYLVLDESCLTNGQSCNNNNQVELIHAITPFGTDAPAPTGDGVVPPRVLTYDITPLRPLLVGHKWVGTEIGMYVQAGWHVTVDFNLSKRPEEASAKKPAAGVQVIGFGGAPLPTKQVTVPANATKVYMRLFTTGHGGTQYCDGGTNNGNACTASSQCPGGSCQNCDEFCHRTNRILKNGTPIWQGVPFKTCCTPKFPGDPFCQGCTTWNACGYPSCTFDRAGWCPGTISCQSNAPCDQDLDMTSQLPAGGTYNIDYDVLVQRGSWAVSLLMYWYTN